MKDVLKHAVLFNCVVVVQAAQKHDVLYFFPAEVTIGGFHHVKFKAFSIVRVHRGSSMSFISGDKYR